MGKALLDVSCELLADLLGLPGDTEVVQALLPKRPETIRFVIEGTEVPETEAGLPWQVLTPVVELVKGQLRFVRWM